MEHQYDKILAGFLRHAKDDDVGLWQIINRISQLLNINEQSMTVAQGEQFWAGISKLVTMMLQGGFLAINLRKGGGYDAWPQQDPKHVLARIRKEWIELKGKFPDVGFIVWFHKS